MTREETIKAITKLSLIYDLEEKKIDGVVDIWSNVFKDTEYWKVDRGIDNYIAQDTRDYPKFPIPGNIRAFLPCGW